jgi:heme exporter protein C
LEGIFLRLAPGAVAVLIPLTIWCVFFWVPTDAFLGLSQRIFYYHVPSATTSFLGFASGGIASAVFLAKGRADWDHAARAAIDTAIVFATMVLVSGSIWARTAWGTWWTWDARLTTFLVLWLVFVVYELLRSYASENELGTRYAAVLAVVGTVNIPLVMMATRLWRTIHPQVIRNPQGGIDDPAMETTLGLCMFTFFALFAWLWALRVRGLRLEERVAALTHDSLDEEYAR